MAQTRQHRNRIRATQIDRYATIREVLRDTYAARTDGIVHTSVNEPPS